MSSLEKSSSPLGTLDAKVIFCKMPLSVFLGLCWSFVRPKIILKVIKLGSSIILQRKRAGTLLKYGK